MKKEFTNNFFYSSNYFRLIINSLFIYYLIFINK